MLHKKQISANVEQYENVKIELIGADGKAKKLFQENVLGAALLMFFRSLATSPIDEESGQVKPGLLNYLSAYGLRIPFLTGMWTHSLWASNIITDTGRAAIASRLNGSGGEALFDKIGVGIGITAAAVGDTALGTEKDATGATSTVHAVSAATVSRVTTSVTNDTAQMVGTVTFSATLAITESGLFNLGTAGVMLARRVFSAINVVSTDSLQLTWKVQAS